MTRKDVQYRSYDQRDLDAIVELDAACFQVPFRFSKGAMRRFAEAENAWVIVAERDGQVAGFCIVHREHAPGMDIGYVVTIDVEERWRGSGIGEEMLSRGETWVRSWKGKGMMLHVFVKNERAVRFYKRMKYALTGVQEDFYGSGLDAATYWKDLKPLKR
jgi:ribosomal-protein-alanine N-acetyltransferase